MKKRFFRTPRSVMIVFVVVVNLLSGLISGLFWMLLPGEVTGITPRFGALIPMTISILIAFVISSLMSKPTAKPLIDMIEATKAISKGDYSVRVDEVGEGEIFNLLHSFNQMTAELAGTELMRNDFINVFSHEFKTPIVSIRGFAKRLRHEHLTEEKQKEYLDYIVDESQRLSELAGNILLLSKYENQQLVGEQEVFALDEQLRECILSLEKEWTAKELSLDIELRELSYRGNPEMLRHVWLNLIGNAIKFTPPGGTVSVSAGMHKDAVEVRVGDNGIGMSEEAISHIFDKFYQADASHSSAGNGLGLPLVRRIVELCGGMIAVESQPEVGTVFRVTLPI